MKRLISFLVVLALLCAAAPVALAADDAVAAGQVVATPVEATAPDDSIAVGDLTRTIPTESEPNEAVVAPTEEPQAEIPAEVPAAAPATDTAEAAQEPVVPKYEVTALSAISLQDTVSGTCGDNLTWSLDTSTGVLTISGTGAMWNWGYNDAPRYSYRSSIKSVTIESGVTTIGDYAFAWCDSLTSLTIPDSVTTIGNEAFYGCDSLTSVTIPDSVTTIGDCAFEGTSLTSVTIPDSVTTIGNGAFYECTKLTYNLYDNGKYLGNESNPYLYLADTTSSSITSCTIHPSTRFIGYGAFCFCTSLTSVTIGNSVTTIGNLAFYHCTNLTSVTIGNSVTTIGYEAFRGCDSLTSVTIPDSVTTIGDYAFDNCSSLTSVTIPDNVTIIGECVFNGCDSLTSITVSAGNPNYSSQDGVLFNKDKTTLIQCPGGKSGAYIIPDSVTTIGHYAFEYCRSLTSVTIPDSVTTIGNYAFEGCTKLNYNLYDNGKYLGNMSNPYLYLAKTTSTSITNFTIHPDTRIIGHYAFEGTSLTSVTIPNSVTTIGNYAFNKCTKLMSVKIPDSVTTIGDYAFYKCTSLIYNLYDNGKYLGNESNPYLYLADTTSRSITNCTIHPSTRFIGDFAFESCTNLTSVTIPDSVTTIGNHAFHCCFGLTSVTIPNSVTTIGGFAFAGCDSLTSVTIPDSVTTIGNDAFSDCTNLTSVTIGNSVTTIGDFAFYYCNSLNDVYFNGTKAQWENITVGENNVTLRSAALHTLPEPQLTDYSLNLDSAIRLNFYVSAVDGYTSYIDMDGTRYNKDGDYYPTRLFHAKEMADNVKATLKYEYDGETTESTSFTTSIQKYAEAVLKDVVWETEDGDYGAKSGALMVAMLNYGAEAQKYFDYNTANLANANIGTYQTHLTPAPAATDERTGNDKPLYYGTSVVLGANMNMKFYLKLKTAEDKEGWNYQISYTNYLGQKNVINLTFADLEDAQNGFFSYTLDRLVAADIDTMVTFKILDNETEKLAVTDSISSYLARVVVANPECTDVANAMLTFGAAAQAYFGKYDPPVLGDDELPLG